MMNRKGGLTVYLDIYLIFFSSCEYTNVQCFRLENKEKTGQQRFIEDKEKE